MKKLLLFFAAMCCMMVANAQQFTDANGIKYNVTSTEDKTVEVIANGYYSGSIEIPATVTYNEVTYRVTRIGDNAFDECEDLTSVTLPEGVESIGYEAFDCCYALTSVDIPNTLTEIGDYAFYWCESLSSITLLEGLKSIEEYAFAYCKTLTSVNIPSTVTEIGDYAFVGCYVLTSISVDEDNTVYDSRNDCNAIIETATNTLITGSNTTIIPSSVTAIADYAFYGYEGLASITIPSTVKSIGKYAFYDCDNLASVTLSEGLESIGDYAFAYCYELTFITIPSTVKSIGKYAFYDCFNLVSVTLSEGLESIGEEAFSYCESLISVILPEGLESIGKQAFDYCYKLTSVFISGSVTSIGAEAFNDCRSLSSISVDEGNTTYDSRDNCNAIIETETNTLIAGCNSTVIPSSVTAIGALAFYGFSNLTSITIPSSVTAIGNKAFKVCTGLESITVLASNPPTLGEEVFYDVTAIPVYVPDVDAFSGWGGFTNFIAIDIDDYKQAAIAEIDAAKTGVTLSEDEETAISGYKNTITGVTTLSDDNLATIDKAKNAALTVISQAAIRPAREAALAAIEAAMQGETGTYITGLVQPFIDAINASTDETYIDNVKNTAVAVLSGAIQTYKLFKANILGSLGEKQNGPALIVTDKDGNEIILYAPKSVEYIKVNEE